MPVSPGPCLNAAQVERSKHLRISTGRSDTTSKRVVEITASSVLREEQSLFESSWQALVSRFASGIYPAGSRAEHCIRQLLPASAEQTWELGSEWTRGGERYVASLDPALL